MKKIITFGELLLRLSPAGDCKIGQTPVFNAIYGGSEANVAIALARYNCPTSFVSLLPDNEIGQDALRTLHYHQVDTNWLRLTSRGRMGIYFIQPAYKSSSRNCIYDRSHSSISLAQKEDFHWDEIFKDAIIFHFSGITPALSPVLREICKEACEAAHRHGLLISCDINYRSKLWSKQEASLVMQDLCSYADILFINEEEATLLGIKASGETLVQKEPFLKLVRSLTERYQAGFITTVARVPVDAINLGIQAILWHHGERYQSRIFPLQQIIDPNGAGDAYAAAILYGISKNLDPAVMVNFAAAACNLKHSCYGDANLFSLEDIWNCVATKTANGIQR